MYSNDRESGRKSCCAICRQAIISAPNRIFGNFPTERISYSLGESISPNITGRRGGKGNDQAAPTNVLLEQLEFYEGRLADLEAQIEEYGGMDANLNEIEGEMERLRGELEVKSNELNATVRKLNERDLSMMRMIEAQGRVQKKLEAALDKVKVLEEGREKLNFELKASKTELLSYQDSKLSLETERLASEITRLQSESYFKNLRKFHSETEIIGLLAGMHAKFNESENGRNELERENRKLKIEMEKLTREVKGRNSLVVANKQTDAVFVYSEPENRANDPLPQLLKRSPTLNASKLVPNIRPKGLPVPRGPITGTGKRAKIIEMPDGTKRIA